MQGEFRGGRLRVGFVGTYPPTRCGIATFTASLASALADAGCRIGVVACVEAGAPLVHSAEVIAHLCGTSLAVEHAPARGGEIRHSLGARARAEAVLALAPPAALASGLAATIAWMRRAG